MTYLIAKVMNNANLLNICHVTESVAEVLDQPHPYLQPAFYSGLTGPSFISFIEFHVNADVNNVQRPALVKLMFMGYSAIDYYY